MPFGKESMQLVHAFRVYAQVGILNFKARPEADRGVHVDAASMDAKEMDVGYLSELVVELCRAQKGFIFMVEDAPKRLSYLDAAKSELYIELSENTLPGHVVLNNETLNIPDCSRERRFAVEIGEGSGTNRQTLCIPVCDANTVLGAIQICNSHNGEPFAESCVEVMQAFRPYILVAMKNHRDKLKAHRQVRDAIESRADGAMHLGYLTEAVVELTRAQRGSILVLEKATNELRFLATKESGEQEEIRIPLNAQSVSGSSIVHNEIINISNCYADDRFDRTIDEKTGFKSRQMLCVPVADQNGEAIGTIQIINTENGLPFSPYVFELLRAFRPFIQMAILKRNSDFGKLLVAAPSELARISSFSNHRSVDPSKDPVFQ